MKKIPVLENLLSISRDVRNEIIIGKQINKTRIVEALAIRIEAIEISESDSQLRYASHGPD